MDAEKIAELARLAEACERQDPWNWTFMDWARDYLVACSPDVIVELTDTIDVLTANVEQLEREVLRLKGARHD